MVDAIRGSSSTTKTIRAGFSGITGFYAFPEKLILNAVQFWTDAGFVPVYICSMVAQITIVEVERDGVDGIIVTFSDGTTAGYVVEELLQLRPAREPIEEAADPKS